MNFFISKLNIQTIKNYFLPYNFVLLIIFIFSFMLRLIGINWDSGYLFHPDERAILMHGYDLTFDSINSFDFFNADASTLNPKWFNYRHESIYF